MSFGMRSTSFEENDVMVAPMVPPKTISAAERLKRESTCPPSIVNPKTKQIMPNINPSVAVISIPTILCMMKLTLI
jgi:hypothetical protein